MEAKDVAALIVWTLSACAGVAAAIVARSAVSTNRQIQKWIVNHDLLDRSRDMLIAHPDLLHLHGITPETLLEDGLSLEEIIYVNLHFDAGGAFYRIGGDRSVELTEVRKNFIRNERVRFIWKKHLRGRLFNDTPYSRAIDAYISELEGDVSRITTARSSAPGGAAAVR